MSIKDFDSIQIKLASPDKIREWSHGEVTKAETINYRTLKPEPNGLFCEKIFGPSKDYECSCGKYKRLKHKGIKCEKCGVDVTTSKVRRERMGHIELEAPVAHIWFSKGTPNKMSLLLGVSTKDLEAVLYHSKYIVVSGDKEYPTGSIIQSREYELIKLQQRESFVAKMGAEGVYDLLKELDLDKLDEELEAELEESTSIQKRKNLLKDLK